MANHVQRITKVSGSGNGILRIIRQGFIAEEITIPPTATAANVKALVEATNAVTTVAAVGTLAAGIDVTITNPANTYFAFDVLSPGYTSSALTEGTTLEEQLGTPQVDQITPTQARLTPPVGGKPAGITAVKLQLRSRAKGSADVEGNYTAWADVIADINFAASQTFASPENRICVVQFVVVP